MILGTHAAHRGFGDTGAAALCGAVVVVGAGDANA